MNITKKIIVVAGPTASGKSDFAVELAHKYNGEVISADSRQVYKGLDIGTGKITQEEMKGIPHHMIDIVEADTTFSVADYTRIATPIIHSLLAQGKTPIICGGTGQYIDSLIYNSSFPKVPPNEILRATLEKKSNEELHTLLTQKDPLRAKNIDSHNKVRLTRALEIIEMLGTVPLQDPPCLLYDTELYLMSPTREQLRARIHARLLSRLDQGMLKECEQLLSQGITHERLEKLGLEYRYMSRYLRGALTYDEFVTTLTSKICQYAKRQETWNKKYEKFAKKNTYKNYPI